jgi:hypothetical protein
MEPAIMVLLFVNKIHVLEFIFEFFTLYNLVVLFQENSVFEPLLVDRFENHYKRSAQHDLYIYPLLANIDVVISVR